MLIHKETATLAEVEASNPVGDDYAETGTKPGSGNVRGEQFMTYGNKAKAYQTNAGAGYSNAPQPGMPTYTEAWALIEAARRMAVATDHADQGDIKDRNKVRDALRLN